MALKTFFAMLLPFSSFLSPKQNVLLDYYAEEKKVIC